MSGDVAVTANVHAIIATLDPMIEKLCQQVTFWASLIGLTPTGDTAACQDQLPEMIWLYVAGVPRFGLKWCVLQCVSFICLLVSLGAAVGSIAQIVLDTEDYTPFVTNY